MRGPSPPVRSWTDRCSAFAYHRGISLRNLVLHELIAVNREEIIRRCRAKVATRSVPPPTAAEIDHGVPVFLEQLRDALRLGQITSPEIGRRAIKHGHDLLLQGFTVSQVVHDYGDVCQAISATIVLLSHSATAQDLSRYRDVAFGSGVSSVVAITGTRADAVKVIHQRPALIQEIVWRPQYSLGRLAGRTEAVQEVTFRFYDDQMFMVTVVYDARLVEGLTNGD